MCCNVIIKIALIIGLFAMVFHVAKDRRETEHFPITPDMVSVVASVDSGTYDISSSSSIIIDGSEYVTVTVNGYSKQMLASRAEGAVENDKISSDIYIAKVSLNEPYLLSFLTDTSVEFVRFSCLGESDFTDAELENLKKEAASYLTYKKYSLLMFDDVPEEPNLKDYVGGNSVITGFLSNN